MALFLPGIAFCAEILIESEVQEISVGQQFKVDLMLDAEDDDINAIEGEIIFPVGLLELKEIRYGSSIVSFWVDKPKEQGEGSVYFSGVMPGGFRGMITPGQEGAEPGKVLSLIFQAKNQGTGVIEMQMAKALLNDGMGTSAKLKIQNLQFTVETIGDEEPEPYALYSEDKDPPEEFVPQIASDPLIFEGKWFLVFAAQDKGSGINRYEIKELRQRIFWMFLPWKTVESPYVLADQELKSYNYIKALDNEGNYRIAKLAPQNPLPWYQDFLIWCIIMVIVAVTIFFLIKAKWKKSRKSHY